MQVIHDLGDLRRAPEEKLVLVPTMGGLHEGHSSLIKLATNFSRAVLVSVFINPLQFEDSKDMENYPYWPEKMK